MENETAHENSQPNRDEAVESDEESKSAAATLPYKKAEEYWNSVEPSVDGMLGGFPHLSDADVRHSQKLIRWLVKKNGTSLGRALDCGSGIGRVTKMTLLPLFESVDMVDCTESFIQSSSEYLGPDLDSRVQKKITAGLQHFEPEKDRYDVIWVQWVSGHLTDTDFVHFFRTCKASLRANGVLILKENVTKSETSDFDEVDHSWTRTKQQITDLFAEAGCKVLQEQRQKDWPSNMYPVYTWAIN